MIRRPLPAAIAQIGSGEETVGHWEEVHVLVKWWIAGCGAEIAAVVVAEPAAS